MASTPNSQAVQTANALITLSGQLMALYQQMVILDAAWTDDAVATTLAAMGTTAINTDGTIGAADGSPNAAHPMSLTIYPNLTRAVSSTQIGQAKTIMDGLVSYINGGAVSTQVGARAILNAVIGG
jgi:hypothetical protein